MEAIQTVCPEFPSHISAFVCNEESSSCMLGECERCGGLNKFDNVTQGRLNSMDSDVVDKVVQYKQWQNTRKNVCIADSLSELEYFLRHTLVKRRQSEHFQNFLQRTTVDNGLIVIQVFISINSFKDIKGHFLSHMISVNDFVHILSLLEICVHF
jgi:hypothetical protein